MTLMASTISSASQDLEATRHKKTLILSRPLQRHRSLNNCFGGEGEELSLAENTIDLESYVPPYEFITNFVLKRMWSAFDDVTYMS